jgi:AraC-like DNA-binding protein
MSKKASIQLLAMPMQRYGISISPMLADFSTLDNADLTETPHRHDFFSLFLLEDGLLEFSVDLQRVTLAPTSLLLLNPGLVHQCITMQNIRGWVMAFDAKHIEQPARVALQNLMQQMLLISLQAADLPLVKNLLEALYKGIKTTGTDYYYIKSLLNTLFYKLLDFKRISQPAGDARLLVRPAAITQQFLAMVKQYYLLYKKPSWYAGQMSISTGYLNDTLKAVTGLAATHYIQQEVMAEAQRLLLYTSKSIKEIASHLGYDDCKYFIRLFGKLTGTSPAKFRVQDSAPPGLN